MSSFIFKSPWLSGVAHQQFPQVAKSLSNLVRTHATTSNPVALHFQSQSNLPRRILFYRSDLHHNIVKLQIYRGCMDIGSGWK